MISAAQAPYADIVTAVMRHDAVNAALRLNDGRISAAYEADIMALEPIVNWDPRNNDHVRHEVSFEPRNGLRGNIIEAWQQVPPREHENATINVVHEVEVQERELTPIVLAGVQNVVTNHTVEMRVVVMGTPTPEQQGTMIDVLRDLAEGM